MAPNSSNIFTRLFRGQPASARGRAGHTTSGRTPLPKAESCGRADSVHIASSGNITAEPVPAVEMELPVDGQHILLLLHELQSPSKTPQERGMALQQLCRLTADSKGARQLLASIGGVEALILSLSDEALSFDDKTHAGALWPQPVNLWSTRLVSCVQPLCASSHVVPLRLVSCVQPLP